MSDEKQRTLIDVGATVSPKERAKVANKARMAAKSAVRPEEAKARSELHQRIVDLYITEFARARGVAPVFDGADGAAVKRLIDKLEGDETKVRAAICGAYSHRLFATIATIREIASNPMKYTRGEAPKRKNRFAQQPCENQTNHETFED